MIALLLATALQAPSSPPAVAEQGAEPYRVNAMTERQRVEVDGTLRTTWNVDVLLRTSAGVAAFGQLEVPYAAGLGSVEVSEVVIEKPDGGRSVLKDLKPEEINPFGVNDRAIAADLRVGKVQIPGLEPGDRLSYRMTLHLKPLTAGQVFGMEKLRPMHGDPIQTYELDVPRSLGVRVLLREGLGAAWEDVPSAPDRLVRRLSVRVPHPVQRPEGPTEAEQQSWIEPDVQFSNFASWDEVGRWWWNLSKDRLRPDETVKTEAERIVAGLTTPRAKAEAIHAFVRSRIRYLNVGFGIGRLQPRAAGDVLASRFGDCKDKHALFAALAAAAGLDTRPVMIHTGRRDLRDDVPGPQQFDHVITVVSLGPTETDWLWVDSTNSLGLTGYLHHSLRDKRSLLIKPDGNTQVVRTPADPPFASRVEVDVKGSLEAAGELRAHMRWTLRSDSEVYWRGFLGTAPKERYAEAVRTSLAAEWAQSTVKNVVSSDPFDLSEPLRIEFDIEKPLEGVRTDKEWTLWIPIASLDLREATKATPGQQKAVEFWVRDLVLKAEISLPERITARAPLAISLDRPFGRFVSTYEAKGRVLRVERMLKLNRSFLGFGDIGGYESFRTAIDTDRKQDFVIGALPAGAASAAALRGAGEAAAKAKEYDKAIDLYRQALAKEPKLADGWNDLGRALRDKGDTKEALEAFSKQIEIEPFDKIAYAERANILMKLDRGEEAEKDLLKQIAVNPFEDWSYARLAERRMKLKRFGEAADYFRRASTIKPDNKDYAIDLGHALALDQKRDEARTAFERARSLKLYDWELIRCAHGFSLIGDEATAGAMAEQALPSIEKRLMGMTAETLDDGSGYWTWRLTSSWHLIGAAALAAGKLAKAEEFLLASWRVGLHPEAAWSLGILKERQGGAAEAALWFAAAAHVGRGHLPADREAKLKAFAAKTAPADAAAVVMATRTVPLAGAPNVNMNEAVVMLLDVDGRATFKRKGSGGSWEPSQKRQVDALSVKFDRPRPDDRSVKLVLDGLLSCYKGSTCALVLDLP